MKTNQLASVNPKRIGLALVCLTRVGEIVGDPFACTETIGDADNARVGQGRLTAQQEGIRTVIAAELPPRFRRWSRRRLKGRMIT
jgi:hypothetical protein